MIASINGFIIFCLIFTSAYFLGLLTFLADNEKEKCDMTYMFEVPRYVRISNNFEKHFPKYALYYYDEGAPHTSTPKFRGMPVLFIPGNAGSYKQVRSLASVALRKAMSGRLPFHFDYFALDMNEELTGLSGIFLNDQLDYVNRSLHLILTLYKNQKYAPTSVILFGHSMGGVIARKLAQMPSSPVQIVVTLASPHKRSPIILDEHISSFYDNVKDPIRENITFISLSGGYGDFLVPSTLTDSKDNSSLYAITTHVPLVWVPADHTQIMWCKQIVLALTRCLFDCVDPRRRQISDSSEYRKRIFEHHLLEHSGTNAKFREKYYNKVNLEENAKWIEKLPRQYSVRFLNGVRDLQWYMVRLVDDVKHEMLTVVGLNLEIVDWIFACNAYIPKNTYKICEDGMHLTHLSTIDPSARYKRRSLTINLHDLKNNYTDELSHVVFKVAPTKEPVVYHVDVYNRADRTIHFKLPNWSDLWMKTIIKETAGNAIRYEIHLSELTHIVQSFLVYLRPFKCSKDSHHSTLSLVVPWGNENSHKHVTEGDRDPFHIRLYNSKPNGTVDSAILRLTLDPNCRYEVRIQRSIRGTLNQMARFYTPLLIVNISTVILLILKTQLQSLGSEKGCTSFFSALKNGTKPYYVLGSAKLGTAILSYATFSKFLPVSNWHVMKEDGIDFFLLPYIMYLISIGVLWVFASLVTVWITLCESTIHKMFLKFLTKTVPFTIIWSEYMVEALQKIPVLVSTAIICISYSACGGLALALGTIFYFLKLTQMSQEFIEETVFTVIKRFIVKCRRGKTKMELGNKETISEHTNKEEKDEVSACSNPGDENDVKDLKNDDCNVDTKSSHSKKEELINSQANFDQTRDIGSVASPTTKESIDKKLSPPSAISFHGVMFLIWVLATIINLPTLATWARNYRYSASLHPDPSFLPGFLLSVCTIPLWQFEMPNIRKKWYVETSYLINTIAVIGLIYAPIYIYRLNYLLSAVVVIVVLHQVLAPVTSAASSKDTQDEELEKYDIIKTKLE
ncbi:hypothetical protein WA026_000205 [Henosepilachna vigintioctopunctata]|uniref:GPI inositol-deacylase n=1 Tax=Henosepilachna vigintioctopunctata TaxID=420089 RepID=A0AAW1V5A3_9CUCU